MTRGIYTILLLILSNMFMTLAWYGHLKFREMNWFQDRVVENKPFYRLFLFNFSRLFHL
jgi:uncharacterized protein (DUF486 family)